MLADLKTQLENRLKHAPPLDHTVLIDLGEDGKLVISEDNQVSEVPDAAAETTLMLTLDTMQKIVSGDTDPNMAVLTGKLKIGGKMGVALKLASYLED